MQLYLVNQFIWVNHFNELVQKQYIKYMHKFPSLCTKILKLCTQNVILILNYNYL